jgi:hypothetical protein
VVKRVGLRTVLPVFAAVGVLALSLIAPSPARIFGLPVASCGYSYGSGSGPTPVVTGVAPNFGSVSGGTNVTITGSGFCNNTTAVNFGATPAANFVLDDDTHIRATAPAEAAGTVDVTVTTGNGTSPTSSADQFTFITDTPGVYTPRSPLRLLDTRSNGSGLGTGGTLNLAIGGVSVPGNATSVIINVTVTRTTAPSFLTAYPTGTSRPTASNLNWLAGQTIANLVSVKLGSGGSVSFFNAAGHVDVIVDLQGYFAPPDSGAGTDGEFVPLTPARITDTRTGSGQPNAGLHVGPNSHLDVQVAGAGGVPASGAIAAVLNVVAVNQTANSYATAWPTGAAQPTASNIDWVAHRTAANRVIVPIGAGGKVSFYNAAGTTDLVIDVNGYFTDGTLSGGVFSALAPARIMDTRTGLGGHLGKVGPGQTIVLHVAGQGGVPLTSASTPPRAVILNVTETVPTAPSFLTLFPDGTSRPNASDLNFYAGQTVPNLVVVKLGASGDVDIFNAAGATNVVVDVAGWFG